MTIAGRALEEGVDVVDLVAVRVLEADVDDVRAVLTCARAISAASSNFSAATSRLNFRLPMTFVRSPTRTGRLSVHLQHLDAGDERLAEYEPNQARPVGRNIAAYQPLPGLSVNGKLTLTENIADLGGLAAAFDAYRMTLGSRVADTDFVREQDREFFIAYAQTQRRKTSETAVRKQVATDNHAPEDYRADTVRNLDAWYVAFDVRPGQRLYLEPSARVRVW